MDSKKTSGQGSQPQEGDSEEMKNSSDSVENQIKELLKENKFESINAVFDDLKDAQERIQNNTGNARRLRQAQDDIEFLQNFLQKHAQLVQLLLDDFGFKSIDDAIEEKSILITKLNELPPTRVRARNLIQEDIDRIDEILRISGHEERPWIPPTPGGGKPPDPKPPNPPGPIPQLPQVHPQSLFEREMEDAQIHAEFIKNSPDSFEKSVKILTHILYQKLNNKMSANDDFINVSTSQYNELIHTHLDNIKTTFVGEVNKNNDIMTKVKSLQHPNGENTQQFESILNCLKQIQPLTCRFNFQEFFSYIKEAEKVSQSLASCQNNTIVLLLGTTGAGKSTTIHYVCGSEMYETSENGLKHIAFRNVKNDDLLNFRVSPFSRSETRWIRPIEINLKQLGASMKEMITLIDTPGLFDLKNAEVDVSNQIGIVKALQQIKSIRPFIVFSYKRLGARGEGLKEILNFYAEMIVDSNYIEYFNFFFSHVDKAVRIENLTSKIQNILDELNPREQLNARLVKFLQTIVSRAEDKKIFIIDPLNDRDVLKIAKDITKTEEIPNPSQVFQKVVCEESKSKIIEQFDLHKKAILRAFKEMNGDRVNYLLNELKTFCEIMDSNQDYKQQMNEILTNLNQRLEKYYTEVVNIFTKQLKPGNKIGEQEVGTYHSNHHFLYKLEEVRRTFLCEIDGKPILTHSDQDLEQEVERIIKNAFVELNDPDPAQLDQQNLQDYLQKLEFLANSQISKAESIKVEVNKKIQADLKDYQIRSKQLLGQIMTLDQDIINNANQNQVAQEELKNSEEDKKIPKPLDQFAQLLKVLEKAEQITKSSSLQKEIREQIDSINKILKDKFSEMIKYNFEEFQQINLSNAINISNLTDDELNQQALIPMNKLRVDTISKYYQFLETFIRTMISHALNQSLIEFLQKKQTLFNDQMIFWYSVQEEKLKRKISQDRKYSAIKSIYEQIMLVKNLPALKGQVMRQNRIKMNLTKLVKDKSEEAKKYMKEIEGFIQKKQPEEGKSIENQQINFYTLVQLKDAIRTIKELYWTIEGGNEEIYNELKEDLEKNLQALIDLIEDNVEKSRQDSQNKNDIGESEQAFKQIAEIQSIAKIIGLELQDINIEKYIPEIEQNLNGAERFFTSKGIFEISEEQKIETNPSDLLLKKSECKIFFTYYTFLNLLRTKDFMIKKIDDISAKIKEKNGGSQTNFLAKKKALVEKLENFVGTHMDKVSQVFDSQLIEMDKYLKNMQELSKFVDQDGFYQNQNHQEQAAMYLTQYLIFPVEIIANIFKMIRELKLNYHQLWSKLSQNEDYEEIFRQKVWKFYKGVEEGISLSGNDQVKISNGLKIINHLIPLDIYINEQIDDKIFQKQYDHLFKTICTFNNEVIKNVKEHMENRKYNQIKQILVTLQQLDGMEEQPNMKKVQNILQQKCNYLISQISREIKFLVKDKKLDDEKTENINKKSSELQEILEKIGEKYLTKQIYLRCQQELKNVQEQMSSNFDKLLDFILKQINDKKFKEAHQSIIDYQKSINQCMLYSPSTLTDSTILSQKDYIKEMDQLPEKLKLAIDNLVDEFEGLCKDSLQSQDDSILEKIIKKSPREIVENLQNSSNEEHNENGQKIMKIIQTILDEKIQNLSKRVGQQAEKNNGQEILDKIHKYLKIINHLPEKLNDLFKKQIDGLKINYENGQDEASEKIIQFINQLEKNKEELQLSEVYDKINESKYGLNKDCQAKFIEVYKNSCKGELQKICNSKDLKGFQLKIYQLWLFESTESVKKQLDKSSLTSFANLKNAIKDIYQQIINKFTALFQNQDIETVNKVSIILDNQEKQIDFDIQIIESYYKLFENKDHFVCANEIISDAGEKLIEVIEIGTKEIKNISTQISSSMASDDPQSLQEIFKIIVFMRNIKEAQKLLSLQFDSILKSSTNYAESIKKLKEFKDVSLKLNHSDLCKQIVEKYQKLNKINDKPNFFKVNDPSVIIEADERKKYYEGLKIFLTFVQESQNASQDLQKYNIDTQKIQKDWVKKIQDYYDIVKKEAEAQLEKLMGPIIIPKDINQLLENLFLTEESFNLIVPHEYSAVQLIGFNQMKDQVIKIKKILSKQEEIKANEKDGKIQNPLAQQISDLLTKLKGISLDITQFKVYAHQQIKDTLDCLQKQQKNHNNIVTEIAMILKSDPIGAQLIEEQEIFIQEARTFWAKKIQLQDIEYVLKNLETNGNLKLSQNEIQVLRKQYADFEKKYTELVEKNIVPYSEIPEKKQDIKRKLLDLTQKQKTEKIDFAAKNKLYEILAHLFALWTLLDFEKNKFNCDDEKDVKKVQYILKPHPAQLISIFRMFGIGYDTIAPQDQGSLHQLKIDQLKQFTNPNTVFDNLVQIKTGEGKSITLAMVISVYALWDFHVSCACYSDYLSKRDHESFIHLYEFLNIHEQIVYGTFNQICEKYINKDGEIRDLTLKRILKDYPFENKKVDNVKKRVILIDEVDVFFGSDFFNMCYSPVAQIQNDKISNLLDLVWAKRDDKIQPFTKIKESQQYKECVALFNPEYVGVFEEACKDIFGASRDFSHTYVVKDGKIGYQEMDQISFTKSEGYKTIFAHYKHNEIPWEDGQKVSNQSLKDCKKLLISCGIFSYAEIPLYSMLILGVTGTLQSLSESQMKIIKDTFQIRNFTFTPSVYGESKLQWEKTTKALKTQVVSKQEYYNYLTDDIKGKLQSDGLFRAVVVFFKNNDLLKDYKKSDKYQQIKCEKLELNENDDKSQKEDKITKSTFKNTVTLTTRSFGRGTDFICRDDTVETNGGVHVILTFIPEMNPEFIQIQGRTARQGNKGSFQIILLDESLQVFPFEISLNSQEFKNQDDKLDYIMKKRDISMEKKQGQDDKAVKLAKDRHNESLNIKDIIIRNDSTRSKELCQYLMKINLGPTIDETLHPVKTLILMDATGSMGSFLNLAKNSVNEMYKRSSVILETKGYPGNLNKIQFVCYRNYNATVDQLLQTSGWECKAERLKNFMDQVSANYGMGEEAVELGFQHAVREVYDCEERKGKKWFQIYLIADAPPNPRHKVDARRNEYQSWKQSSKFSKAAYWDTELQELQRYNVKVNTFYLDPWARESFEEIARRSGGVCSQLDPNSEKSLLDHFTTNIVDMIGQANGDATIGRQLREDYLRRYTS